MRAYRKISMVRDPPASCSTGASFSFQYLCAQVESTLIHDMQDELEGTLRGHIGLIEDALDRLEGKPNGNKM